MSGFSLWQLGCRTRQSSTSDTPSARPLRGLTRIKKHDFGECSATLANSGAISTMCGRVWSRRFRAKFSEFGESCGEIDGTPANLAVSGATSTFVWRDFWARSTKVPQLWPILQGFRHLSSGKLANLGAMSTNFRWVRFDAVLLIRHFVQARHLKSSGMVERYTVFVRYDSSGYVVPPGAARAPRRTLARRAGATHLPLACHWGASRAPLGRTSFGVISLGRKPQRGLHHFAVEPPHSRLTCMATVWSKPLGRGEDGRG